MDQVGIRMPAEEKQALLDDAKKRDLSASFIIRRLIFCYLHGSMSDYLHELMFVDISKLESKENTL